MFAEIYQPSFDDFWNAYDKKVGRNYCEKKWNRIKEDKNKILNHVILYVKSTPNKQYRKNPETYLNNECWNDEIIYHGQQTDKSGATTDYQTLAANIKRVIDSK